MSTAMYQVLGADQKPYGPVGMDTLRAWIAEGRIHAQTRVQVEGSAEWKPLAAYSELASLATPPVFAPSLPLPTRTNPMAIAGFVMGLLTVMFGCCCCGVPFNVLGIVFSLIALSQISKAPHYETGKGLAIAGLVLSLAGTAIWTVLRFALNLFVALPDSLQQMGR